MLRTGTVREGLRFMGGVCQAKYASLRPVLTLKSERVLFCFYYALAKPI